ncbi:hypothetical protein C8R48DRAFT_781675 [Suillus tomentosus]|nr:hypothetical protein C8R48DRAFT_781675 [Suillus tomentosus]
MSQSAIKSTNLIATASMPPVWLYQPQRPEILQQLVQLSHEEHAFVALTNEPYDLIGYLADSYLCARSHQQGQTWFDRLDQVGWLAIGDTDHLHPLFKATPAGGDYISAISSVYCRASVRGGALPMWLLQDLLNEKSIQFHPAPFPFGYPPPAYPPATATVQPMYMVPAFAPWTSSAVATCPSDTLQPPAPFDAMSTSNMELNDIDYNYWGLSTVASVSGIGEPTGSISDELLNEAPIGELAFTNFHPDLRWTTSDSGKWGDLTKAQRVILTTEMNKSFWWRIVMLTRFLFLGGLWVGEDLHPFSTTAMDMRRSLTNCFLTALDMVNKTYQQMLEQPVHVTFATGQSIDAGWPIFRVNLSKSLDNAKSDLKKVARGAMSPLTNFCAQGGIQEGITYFVLLLESGDSLQVQWAIQELTVEQAFRELLWTSLLQPIKRLADGHQRGRIADLYLEEIFSRYKCLAQKPVCNLLTFIYHTMISVLGDLNPNDTDHLRPEDMRDILMSASNEMYEKPHLFPQFTEAVKTLPFLRGCNILSICKAQLPMFLPDRTRRRNMTDMMDIKTHPVDEAFDDVPNNEGFSSTMSLRYVWDLPVSYFTKHG